MKTQKTAPPSAAEAVAQPAGLSDRDLIAQIAAVTEKASPDQVERLRRLGIDIPAADLTKAADGEHVLGLRCSKCNEIALYFIGTKFRDVNGNYHDEPQPGMQAHEVAWTQDLDSASIDRRRPKCQHCHQRIPLEGDGSIRIRDRGTVSRLVRVKEWQASRDKANDRRFLKKQLADKNQIPAGFQGYANEDKPFKEAMSETLTRLGKEGVDVMGEPVPQIPPDVVAQVDFVGKKLGY